MKVISLDNNDMNMKFKLKPIYLLFCFLTVFNPNAFSAQKTNTVIPSKSAVTIIEHPSFSYFSENLKEPEKILSLYKQTLTSWGLEQTKEFKRLWGLNSRHQMDFIKKFNQSMPFIRGELEDEKILNNTLIRLQLLMMKVRFDYQNKNWKSFISQLESAFLIAAELPYQESSFLSLKLAHVIRSLIFDELEKIDFNKDLKLFKDNKVLVSLEKSRFPWPIDRILLSDSKRIKTKYTMSQVEKIALELQSNPYRSIEDIIVQLKFKKFDVDHIYSIWTNEDIEKMRLEMNRYGKLLIKLAIVRYENLNKKQPVQIQQLIEAKIIQKIPLDYTTGKPLEISI